MPDSGRDIEVDAKPDRDYITAKIPRQNVGSLRYAYMDGAWGTCGRRPFLQWINVTSSIAQVRQVWLVRKALEKIAMSPSRTDPIGQVYYVPLGKAELTANVAFYATAVLSIAVLIVPPQWPLVREATEIAFPAFSLSLFAIAMAVRLHWGPRAHERRLADLLSNSLKISMVDDPSVGYYNNKETDPTRRLNAAILENAFFGKNIVMAMLRTERLLAGGYAIVWVLALLYRSTDLAVVAVAAQVLLSEQVLSRWLRIEFLHGRLERAYQTAYGLATITMPADQLQAHTIENVILYEVWKAEAGISLSTKVFKRLNLQLSAEWKRIGRQAGVV
jgi:hypothetical protein